MRDALVYAVAGGMVFTLIAAIAGPFIHKLSRG